MPDLRPADNTDKGRIKMPYSDNEKLRRFADEVLGLAEAERRRIESETEAKYEQLLAEGKKKIREETLDYLTREIGKIRQKSGQALSQHTLQKRKELLLYRENILKTVSDKVLAKLGEFVQSPDYKAFLVTLCVKVLKEQDTAFVLYLSESDMQYKEELLSAVSACPELKGKVLDILPEKNIRLGGIRFLSGSGRVLINETLDERFRAEHEHLVRLIHPLSATAEDEAPL